MANPSHDTANDADNTVTEHHDRWIWGVWVVVALLSVAILPFVSRLKEVAVAVASFCGIAL